MKFKSNEEFEVFHCDYDVDFEQRDKFLEVVQRLHKFLGGAFVLTESAPFILSVCQNYFSEGEELIFSGDYVMHGDLGTFIVLSKEEFYAKYSVIVKRYE